MKQEMQGESSPERVVWYRDLVEEMTRCAPQVGQTTVPVLMDGRFWQMVRVGASVPAFVSSAGFAYGAMRGYGETEEEALRALCERVHALTWAEQQERGVVAVWDLEASLLAGAV